jgi:outer membrane murein-binding lipoprotein Lpp
MNLRAARFFVAGFALATVMLAMNVGAQPPAYTACPREPLDARLTCIERTAQAALEVRQMAGRLESDLQTARSELQAARDELRVANARLAALERRPPGGVTRDEAWEIGLDAAYYQLRRYGVVK